MFPTEDLSANIDFTNRDEYQAIYDSQLYGTFFAIYAKLTINNLGTGEYTLQKAELFLLNYKGNLDLGIVQAEFKIAETPPPNKKVVGGIFKIEVQAKYTNPTTPILDNVIKKTFKIYNKKSFLFVDRRLKRLHPQNATNGIALKDGIFDSEFYYREGFIDNVKNSAIKLQKPLKPKEWHDSPDPISIGLGRPKCPRSQMKIF